MSKLKKNSDPLLKKPKSLIEQLETSDNKSESIDKQKAKLRKRKIEENFEQFLGHKETIKILKQARDQIDELESEEKQLSPNKQKEIKFTKDEVAKEEDEEGNISDSEEENFQQDEEEEVDEELKKQFEKFLPSSNEDRQQLSQAVLDSINSKRSEIETQFSDQSVGEQPLDRELVAVYKKVAKVLQGYRHGPVPKPFKIIPKYKIWQQLLQLTDPDKWSAAAVFAGTRIFVSNLKDLQAAKFMNSVLLPRVRDDISEFKRLNDHLYEALMKCMFKSYGFVKGFLLPLCQKNDFSAREATIISSVLSKSSMKMEHGAVAMLEVSKMSYSPANTIVLTTLIDKKYNLPIMVIEELIKFFVRFGKEEEDLPVLWHQCLLTFVQRYKQDLTNDQKNSLLKLVKVHFHKDITNEIRKEITSINNSNQMDF